MYRIAGPFGLVLVAMNCASGTMTIHDRRDMLLMSLRQLPCLMSYGFAVEAGTLADVVIVRYGHVYGIWFVSDDAYAFVPGGYNEATQSGRTVEEALTITQAHFEGRA